MRIRAGFSNKLHEFAGVIPACVADSRISEVSVRIRTLPTADYGPRTADHDS